MPRLDQPLVWPLVHQKIETGRGGADESAMVGTDDVEHASHRRRFEQDVVVQVMHKWRATAFEQELTLFCQTSTGEMPMELDMVAAPLEGSDKRADLDTVKINRVVVRLVRDNHVEISKGLPEETGEDHRQSRFAVAGWNEHVDCGHTSALGVALDRKRAVRLNESGTEALQYARQTDLNGVVESARIESSQGRDLR